MDVFAYIRAVRNGGIFPSIGSGVGVNAAGSHFFCPYLRRLHEFGIDSQSRDALLSAEDIGAVNDVLFHGIHIGIIGGDCGFWLWRGFDDFVLCWFFAGVRFSALHLHTAVLAIPINLETNSLADVPEPHIVAAADVIGGHVGFLSIHKDAVVGKCRFQRFHRLRRRSTQ